MLAGERLATLRRVWAAAVHLCRDVELSEYGIWHAACIDSAKVERIAGIPSGWKGSGQRPACGCAASVDVGDTIPVPTAAPTVMPPHARRCCGAPAPSMHRTRRCSPDGRGAANRSQTARALRCVRNRRRCLTTFKSQKGRRPGDGSPSFEGAAKAAAL
ncbi:MAG: DUF1848 family protein [Ruthenibacterium lactatiformans]